MINHQIFYSVGPDHETRYPVDTKDCIVHLGNEYLAERAAQDYHLEHDGWEECWPIELVLYETEDGPAIDRFSVDCQPNPVFYARSIE